MSGFIGRQVIYGMEYFKSDESWLVAAPRAKKGRLLKLLIWTNRGEKMLAHTPLHSEQLHLGKNFTF
jgi:hypothetical protein